MRAAEYEPRDASQHAAVHDHEPRVDGSARSRGMRRYIANMPIGTKLTIDLADGARLNGNILRVEQDALIMQPRTRMPSPPKRVPFDTIVALAQQSEGLNAGRAIAIGAVAGAAAFTAFFLIVWTVLGD